MYGKRRETKRFVACRRRFSRLWHEPSKEHSDRSCPPSKRFNYDGECHCHVTRINCSSLSLPFFFSFFRLSVRGGEGRSNDELVRTFLLRIREGNFEALGSVFLVDTTNIRTVGFLTKLFQFAIRCFINWNVELKWSCYIYISRRYRES